MVKKFKADNGNWFLRQIFYETTMADKTNVIYTLKDEEHLGYPSISRLYITTNDPTEYQFAVSHLGGWAHWQALCECTWFKPYLQAWRKELETKIKSEALASIMVVGRQGDVKNASAANKYLLDKDWSPEPKRGKGRPSKAEIKEAANEIAVETSQIEKDFERLMN